MKKFLLLLLIPVLFGCDSGHFNNKNPNIPNYNFTFDVNTNLPLYNDLKYAGSVKYIGSVGVRGIFVFYSGSAYYAFDAACPNQALSSCSTMTISGINAVCPCDDVEYSLYSGQSQGVDMEYPMKAYRTEVNGDVIRVYN